MQKKFDIRKIYGIDINEGIKKYLADQYAFDLNVNKWIEALDALGLRENTIVVFSSDQGANDMKVDDEVYNRVI